jgi:rRNA maturation protein Nop10
MMSELLRTTCRHCGSSFVSAHPDQRTALTEQPELVLEERCPHCGATDQYAAVDYYTCGLIGDEHPLTGGTGADRIVGPVTPQ